MIIIKQEDKKITINGHANYSNTNDIVCASVSSIMYTTVNAALRINNNSIKYQDDGKEVVITVMENDHITNSLIINMMALFSDLSSKYPKNIRIESEE